MTAEHPRLLSARDNISASWRQFAQLMVCVSVFAGVEVAMRLGRVTAQQSDVGVRGVVAGD